MRNCGRLLIGLGSGWLLACTGGQSGTEGSTPACARRQAHEVGLDDSTPFGTPRQLFSDAMMFSMPPTSMRWNSPTDDRSFDTQVSYQLIGLPTHAVYTADPAPSCAAGWSLSVGGATLHFKSADGAFNESVSGTLFMTRDNRYAAQVAQFSGDPATPFVGTYDIDSATKKFAHPVVVLDAPVGAGEGYLSVVEPDRDPFIVASWVVPTGSGGSGSAGSSGASDAGDMSHGGSANDAGTGAGGYGGSGGTAGPGDKGIDGGAAGAVASGGSN